VIESISLAGSVAIVTGAGAGLGRAHAIELAARGASLVVNDVNESAADSVVAEIRSRGGHAVAAYDSVATPVGGQRIVDAALDQFGSLDILVNNAGFARNAPFDRLTVAELDAVLDVHLRGAVFVTQPAWRVMKRAGYGRVVMTSSGAGAFGRPSGANYCAAKAGLLGLTASLALEGATAGIHTNCILPVAATEFVARSPLLGDDAERLREVFDRAGGRREPERVTALVVYLASHECDVNGEIFSICFGRYARAFVGLTRGWISGGDEIPSAELVRDRVGAIRDLGAIDVPRSLFDEFEQAAARVSGATAVSGAK